MEAAHLVVKYKGSISGEHGDGQARGDLLEIMYGKEIVQAFREFKAIWDPKGKMNPGKVIDTYGQLNDLRIDNHYNPPELKTHFQFTEDKHSFSRATLRCVGVGECRRHHGGTMCPSYMVTLEEKHSTRGRARLLFEMLEGSPLKDGWKSEPVKEALDLCLACKGCKGDCPVNVDMATYKAEFVSHYYEGRIRPRAAYAFGWIFWWSRLASLIPSVANFFTHAPLLSNIAKKIAGVAPERTIPAFADVTFREWFYNRDKQVAEDLPPVILWADTFNNFFKPETLVAATEVLEAAGFRVIVPRKALCCGRPLYDYGMLTTASRLLLDIMDTLREEIQQGIPIVGLEPSCVAVFRDELQQLHPALQDAKRLRNNTYTLAEFLMNKAPQFSPPVLHASVLVHGHCHHNAVMKMDADKDLLQKMNLNLTLPDSGCCGMAGSFGYEEGDRYNVSIKSGERVLLPAVRKADPATIIVADGFSCRGQIEHGTDRKALHVAQLLQMSLRQNESRRPYPERKYVDGMKLRDKHSILRLATAITVFSITALTVLAFKR